MICLKSEYQTLERKALRSLPLESLRSDILGAVANRCLFLLWMQQSKALRNHYSNSHLLTDQILIELTTPTIIYRFRKSVFTTKDYRFAVYKTRIAINISKGYCTILS